MFEDPLIKLNLLYQKASNDAKESLILVECRGILQNQENLKKIKLENMSLQEQLDAFAPTTDNFYTHFGWVDPPKKQNYQLCEEFQSAITQPLKKMFTNIAKVRNVLSQTFDIEEDKTQKCTVPPLDKKNSELLLWMLGTLTSIEAKLKAAEVQSIQDIKPKTGDGLLKNAEFIIEDLKAKSLVKIDAVPLATAAPTITPPTPPKIPTTETKKNVNNKKDEKKSAGVSLGNSQSIAKSNQNIEIYTSAKSIIAQKKVTPESVDALIQLENKIRKEQALLILNSGPPPPVLTEDQCWLKSVLDQASTK